MARCSTEKRYQSWQGSPCQTFKEENKMFATEKERLEHTIDLEWKYLEKIEKYMDKSWDEILSIVAKLPDPRQLERVRQLVSSYGNAAAAYEVEKRHREDLQRKLDALQRKN